ncbi:unnamed protein product [Cylindrotheca closterium]|uniref:Plastid lipid-associated protein/fibrillin conserved domain-containing protein n=1 Tax=Cylindrotheca closterium TaxID=2856 RepID=A0AAD2CER3_9STRA|nr:unnamed protein product [Cylindrotheca closterium]
MLPNCEEKQDFNQSSDQVRCSQLKNHLRSLIELHNGSTKSPDVVEAIQHLSVFCPYEEHSPEWIHLFMGEFLVQTSPNFPGRLPPKREGDKQAQYTLGKLSFNTFHPKDLVCTLRGVRNVVAPKSDGTFTYDLICDTIVHLPEGDVEAEILNESFCCKDDESGRVTVFFTGSTLSPSSTVLADASKMSLWSKTFNESTLKTAAAERTYFGWLMDKALKRMLGMSVRMEKRHSFRLEFNKAFRGHIDVLYLDEEMRITKGNRGTIVIMERICSHEFGLI